MTSLKNLFLLMITLMITLTTAGCTEWPFGEVCNQENRVRFSYNMATSVGKQCDYLHDWDDDGLGGMADYDDRQDEREFVPDATQPNVLGDFRFDDLHEGLPLEITQHIDGFANVVLPCTDTHPYYLIAGESYATFGDQQLQNRGYAEFREYWSEECVAFWQLEFDFRCWQVEEGIYPDSLALLDSKNFDDWSLCEENQFTEIDWAELVEE